MVNATAPGEICTCTSTARASIPSNATVETRVTIRLNLPQKSDVSVAFRNAIVLRYYLGAELGFS